MSSGDQMRPAYERWRASYPRIFTRPLEIRPDGSTDPNASDFQPYHIESGVEKGQPWTRVQQGYMGANGTGIADWQKTHEIMGHMLLGLLGESVREPFWFTRFAGCASAPTSWAQQALDDNVVINAIWAFLPIEIFAEAARLAFDTTGPGDRSMDWGCELDVVKMRAFFEQLLGAASGGNTVSATPFALQIIDVRNNVPRVAAREVGRAAKSSITVHWNGPPIPAGVDPFALIVADANYHISKDWSPAPGIQGGDGIMYHFLIAPDGRVYKTRDDDAVLWHCGVGIGNFFSYAVQVMVGGDSTGVGDPVTSAQYTSLAQLIAHLGLDDVKPHKIWSGTACPGLELTAWISRHGWEEDMYTQEDRDQMARIEAMLTAPTGGSWLKAMSDKLNPFTVNVPATWLRRMFWGFDPQTRQPKTPTTPTPNDIP